MKNVKKNIIITGSSSGIGQALRKYYESKGDAVIGISLADDDYNCDVSDKEQLKVAFDDIAKKYEKIDILINCAGFGLSGAIELIPEKQIQKEYEKIFSSNNIEKRVFPAIPKRDEVIISEAIKGNNRAVKLFPTLKTENPEAIVYTSRIKSKIERNEAMLKEGCFRTCTPKRSEEEVLSDEQKNLKKLKAKFNFLHKKYVLPLTQN